VSGVQKPTPADPVDLADIPGLDLAALRALWAQHWGDPPPLRSPALMRLLVAWRLQAAAEGGLTTETRRALSRQGSGEAEGRHLGIGARLTRVWQGRAVEVIVEDGGFRWNGQLYPSLSAAATAIAGARWNGPRFFGLRQERTSAKAAPTRKRRSAQP
jgi:hypothetical protein